MNSVEKARKRAAKYFVYHKLSLPVDVESLLKNKATVNEEYIPTNGDAICINEENKPLIIIKRNMSEFRKRFTYAHELGHLEIPEHTGMISCTTEFNDKDINMGDYYIMENEANEFAAELLMPSNWLIQLINQFEFNISTLLTKIQLDAQVSFMASLYNIIPLYKPNTMFIIYNKICDYTHIKMGSLSTLPLCLYDDNGCYDTEWLKQNSVYSENIYDDTMDIYFYAMKRVLTPTEVIDINKNFTSKENCSYAITDIIKQSDISYAHLFKDLIPCLPMGYILKITNSKAKTFAYIKSRNTYISPYEKYTTSQKDKWLTDNCTFNTNSIGTVIRIDLWYFDLDFSLTNNTNDLRDSKSILKEIIDSFITDTKEKMIINGKINGVIGSLNNSINSLDKSEFYNILRQKFYGRTDIEFIVDHPDFYLFLTKKTYELYQKLK